MVGIIYIRIFSVEQSDVEQNVEQIVEQIFIPQTQYDVKPGAEPLLKN